MTSPGWRPARAYRFLSAGAATISEPPFAPSQRDLLRPARRPRQDYSRARPRNPAPLSTDVGARPRSKLSVANARAQVRPEVSVFEAAIMDAGRRRDDSGHVEPHLQEQS